MIALHLHDDSHQHHCNLLDLLVEIGFRKQGVCLILHAMREHPLVPGLQEHGCQALVGLASVECNNQVLADSRAVQLILDTIQRHSESESFHKAVQE